LRKYPGTTIGEKYYSAKNGKSYSQLAKELKQGVSTLKTFAYRLGAVKTIRAEYIVTERTVNYAAMVNKLISSLALEAGVTEGQYRKWIKGEGNQVFASYCNRSGIPVFRCRHSKGRG